MTLRKRADKTWQTDRQTDGRTDSLILPVVDSKLNGPWFALTGFVPKQSHTGHPLRSDTPRVYSPAHVIIQRMVSWHFVVCVPGWPTIGLMTITEETKSNTVDSRYLEFQWTLWNPSRYPYLDISDLQNRGKNNSINHIEQIYMWLWNLERYWKILWKRGEIAP